MPFHFVPVLRFRPKISVYRQVTHTEHNIGGIIVLVMCFLLGSSPAFEIYMPTLIINQQMHYIKFHIKILKITPTCFDPKIILRELRCSLLKSFQKHSQNNSIILTGCCGSISCCVRIRCWECVWLWCVCRVLRSHYVTHDTHHNE